MPRSDWVVWESPISGKRSATRNPAPNRRWSRACGCFWCSVGYLARRRRYRSTTGRATFSAGRISTTRIAGSQSSTTVGYIAIGWPRTTDVRTGSSVTGSDCSDLPRGHSADAWCRRGPGSEGACV